MSAAEASLRKFLGEPLATERSQSQTPAANIPAAALPLTFGVELEFILAVQHEEFAAPAFSWLYAPPEVSSGQSELEKTQLRTLARKDSARLSRAERQHRVYPQLTWASRILKKHGLDHVVATGKLTDVQRWGIVPECTANAEGWTELISKLPDRVRTATLEQWDAKGVELVSRVLVTPDHNQTRYMHSDPALEEIGSYLKAVHGTHNTPWGAFVNKTCGLHMHVGLDPRQSNAGMLPFDLLQHLSYMLLQFEISISALHPRGRRALADTRFATGSMLGSNTLGIRQARHVCDKIPMPLLEQIQDRIFSEDMSIEELAILMSQSMRGAPQQAAGFTDRYKFVNFERLIGDPGDNGARTIEFRQHDGSLNADEIGRWVMFVTRLVRAAERLAARSKPASPDSPSAMSRQRVLEIYMKLPFARKQGSKYKLRCQKQTNEYERLFDLMDMPRLERDYWMGKYKLYNPEEVLGDDELLSISRDDCPVCADEKNMNLLQGSPVTPTSSPSLARNPEGPTTPESSIPFEEVERLRVIWGIRRSAAVEGESSDEGDENSPPFRPGIGWKTTNSDFFDKDVAELGEKQEALCLSATVGRSSPSKRRSAGQDSPSSKRRIS
jgi:hypothetical protein